LRILIHGINFSPELTGIGKYTGEMAEWLSSQGHEVRVVTAPPYYPHWKVAEGFANWWVREEVPTSRQTSGSFVVYRCPLWVPSKPSGLKRVLHLVSFALSSFPIMLWQILWKPDVVLVVEPPLFCAPQALLVARLSSAKAWLHIQDYEVDAAFDLGLLKGIALRRIVAMGERWLMRGFDRVSTISERMLNRSLVKGVDQTRMVLFPNWVDLISIRNEAAGRGRYREELGIESKAVIALYSGNMGGKQGLEILAQAAQLLCDVPNLVFVFCGNGAGRDDLITLCDDLPNVQFIELQPLERLGELLAMADIHLLPQRADAADLVMPSKLTGMLASGRPVVVTAHLNTELAHVMHGCGLVVQPEQPQAFADAINTLAQDAALRSHLGRAGRAYADANFDRDAILGRLEAGLVKLSVEA
jgi:colanic acid biosynthesis glycosyl transferase WcaI